MDVPGWTSRDESKSWFGINDLHGVSLNMDQSERGTETRSHHRQVTWRWLGDWPREAFPGIRRLHIAECSFLQMRLQLVHAIDC